MSETETKAAFARRIGVSRPWVGKLAGQGLPLADDGKVDVDRAMRWLRLHDKLPASAGAQYHDDERRSDIARRHAADEFEAGMIFATTLLQSRWPALATVAAWEQGLPVDRARKLFDTAAVALAEDGRNWLAENNVQAFADGDPGVWIDATAEPNWSRLKDKG